MRAALVLFAALALASCGNPAPPPPTEGQQARQLVDTATQAYAECILANAKTIAAGGGLPGELAGEALQSCPDDRKTLLDRIRDFHQIGNPSRSPEESAAVADASIKALEADLRERVVVVVGQNLNQGKPE